MIKGEGSSRGALGRDVLMEEVRQLVQVLAHVLFQVQTAPPDSAEDVLEHGIGEALGLTLDAVRALERDEILGLEKLGHEERLALAAVLAMDLDAEGRRRALWLYEAALAGGASVPFDLFDRLTLLRESLPTV